MLLYHCWRLSQVSLGVPSALSAKLRQSACLPFAHQLAVLCLLWYSQHQFDGLVQERHNSSALAMELHFSFTNPSNCNVAQYDTHIKYKNDKIQQVYHFETHSLLPITCSFGWVMDHISWVFWRKNIVLQQFLSPDLIFIADKRQSSFSCHGKSMLFRWDLFIDRGPEYCLQIAKYNRWYTVKYTYITICNML